MASGGSCFAFIWVTKIGCGQGGASHAETMDKCCNIDSGSGKETHLFHSHLGSRLKVDCCVYSASVLLILAVFLTMQAWQSFSDTLLNNGKVAGFLFWGAKDQLWSRRLQLWHNCICSSVLWVKFNGVLHQHMTQKAYIHTLNSVKTIFKVV